MCENIRNQEGFTLLELLAVIIILGALAAIASPMLNKGDKGRISANNENVTTGSQIADNYALDNLNLAADFTIITNTHSMVTSGYLKDTLKNPWSGVTNDKRQYFKYVLGKYANDRFAILLVHNVAAPTTDLVAADVKGTTPILDSNNYFKSTAYYVDESGNVALIGTVKGK